MTEDYKIVPTGRPIWEPQEVLLKNSGVTPPEGLPVGSVAYTGNLAFVAMWDGTSWNTVKGGD